MPAATKRTTVRPTVARALPILCGLALVGFAAGGTGWTGRVGMVVAAIALAVVALSAWRSDGVTTKRVLTVAIVLRAAALFLPPTLSDDGWRYLFDGLVTVGGHNPYLHVPSDPAVASAAEIVPLSRFNSADYFTVYPPLSQLAFAIAGFIATVTDSAVAGIAMLKLLAFAAEAIALLLLARLVSARSLVLYAWHPLIILEAAGQAHSEALMLPLLVGTVVAASAQRWRLAGVLLAGATMVKLYPALLLPLLWRRGGWRSVWPSLLTLAVLAMPFAHPDVPGHVAESLRLYTSTFNFNAGPYFAVRDVMNGLDPGPENVGRLYLAPALPIFLLAGTLAVWICDATRRWPIDRSFAAILGLVIVTSTTVHPWYLLGLLAMPWTLHRPAWHWLWLSVIAIATYVRYAPGGEAAYIVAVWIGWGGWLFLLPLALLPTLIRRRASAKANRVIRAIVPLEQRPHLDLGWGETCRVLDLGCGEGEVGLALRRQNFDVWFCDVADFAAKEARPLVRYDGHRLPYGNNAFDGVVLYFVLHHSRDAEATLADALRVGRRVVVVESVYRSRWGLRVLTVLDVLANRLRGGRAMAEQEEHLRFRKAAEWRELSKELGATIDLFAEHGLPPHRQATLVLSRRAET